MRKKLLLRVSDAHLDTAWTFKIIYQIWQAAQMKLMLSMIKRIRCPALILQLNQAGLVADIEQKEKELQTRQLLLL